MAAVFTTVHHVHLAGADVGICPGGYLDVAESRDRSPEAPRAASIRRSSRPPMPRAASASAPRREAGSKVPAVSFRVARSVAPVPVGLVGRLLKDLGAGRARPRAVRVHVINVDV